MPRNHAGDKRYFTIQAHRKKQEDRLARKVSSELDEKYSALEARIEESNSQSAGLAATLEDVIEGNKKLVESVLNLMDMAKLKEGPNTTRRKLARLEEKYGKK